MAGSKSRVAQLGDFFLAENRRQALCLFRFGCFGDGPSLAQSLGVEESQSRQMYRNGARLQLPPLKQLGLIFTNVPRAQAVERKVESSRKIFDCADVVACGMLRVIATLEFLQHHFSEMGHGNTSCDPNLSHRWATTVPSASRAASAARAASFLRRTRTSEVLLHFTHYKRVPLLE